MQDMFNAILGEQLGPFGPVILMGTLGAILVLLALPALMRQKRDPMDKLRDHGRNAARAERGSRHEATLRYGSENDKLKKYSSFLEPKDAAEYSAIQLKLIQAGYRSRNAVRMYYFLQFTLGLGGLACGLLYALIKSQSEDLSTQMMIYSILGPAVVGYMAPKYWVTKRQQERQQEITDGFPDALDLMLVCVEAGQSMDQSIVRVSQEIRSGFPSLADEFETVSFEIKAGKDKAQVLRDMAERCGVPDVSSFVTVLIQSQTFGTSIGDALRVYASEMRDKRVMRAEEKANKLPTKMTLATMMLTVPPLLIILIGPSIYDIYRLLSENSF